MEGLAAGNIEAVLEFLNFGAHGAKVPHHQGDAIRFLHPQFPGVADADASAGVGSNCGEDGQFIDELGSQSAADLG